MVHSFQHFLFSLFQTLAPLSLSHTALRREKSRATVLRFFRCLISPKTSAARSRTSPFRSFSASISGSIAGSPILLNASAARSRTSPFRSFSASISGSIAGSPILLNASAARLRTYHSLSPKTLTRFLIA